tara:strand:+ start:1953 stop:2135 length:183 start_codon:yes stop_codon:yes gene_type:complete
MVSFARARAQTWLAKLRPLTVKSNRNESVEMDIYKEFLRNQQEQNKCFFEAIKNGGMWFS